MLDHFDWEINHVRGGVERADGTRAACKIMLLAGADLIQTISTPEVWDARDVDHILGNFGVFVLERTGTDLETALSQLRRWEKNIHVIRQVSVLYCKTDRVWYADEGYRLSRMTSARPRFGCS